MESLEFLLDLALPAGVALITVIIAYRKLQHNMSEWEIASAERDALERQKIRADLMAMAAELRARLETCEATHKECESELHLVTVELAAIKKHLNVRPRT